MNLQNGYKVIYEKAADGMRTFYASKTGVFADAEVIAEAVIGQYKLIYEKDGQFYGSETGIPTDSDYRFTEFDKVFKATVAEDVPATTTTEDEVVEEPVETVVEEDEEPTEGDEIEE